MVAHSLSSSSVARLYTTQAPAWVVWSGFLLSVLCCVALAIVVWRYDPSVWAWGVLAIIAFLDMLRRYQQTRTCRLFLQIIDNQWYVVDHLGELYEVHLLHNWRSPWCLRLRLCVASLKLNDRPAGLGAWLKVWLPANRPYFYLSCWRQNMRSQQWRELNLALSRYALHAGRKHMKESV